MKRRDFINKTIYSAATSALWATIIPKSVLGKNKSPAPNDLINIAFIGTGNNGTNWLSHFFKDKRVRVVAVCDVNREGPGYWEGTIRGREPARRRVNENYSDNCCAVYKDYREVLNRKDIDAVYIGTPDHWHSIMVVEAAQAGKDIYCQKPLALTIVEGRKMVTAVNNANVVLQTGSQQRSDYNFRRICELVQNGRIGRLHTVTCGLPGGIPDFGKTAHLTETAQVPEGFDYDMWLGPTPKVPYCPARVGVNFRWNFHYSGGQLTDWGGHHPDIAQWGMGTQLTGPVKIQNARATFAQHPIYNTATDYYYECIYENGVKLVITNQAKGGVTFEGTEGKVWAKRGSHLTWPESLRSTVFKPDEIQLYKSNGHVKNFIDCIISRNETIAPVEVGHRSISIAHLGNIAIKLGRDVLWDPVNEKFKNDDLANTMLNRPMRTPWRI
jgi:myo-inositol 2-dehydrogenase / D-chiro-inositol 1-dehydrogenase